MQKETSPAANSTTSDSERPWLNLYPADVPKTIDYPKKPLFSILDETASKYAEKTALSYFGTRIKYKVLLELSNQFANGLTSLGLAKGSRVALILPNIPQFVFCFFGILKAGGVPVPCNPLYKEREIEFQLKDSDSEAVVLLNNAVGQNNYFAEFQKCRPRLASLKQVFVTSVTDYLPPIKKQLAGPLRKIRTIQTQNGEIALVDFIKQQSKNRSKDELGISPNNDLASIQYTGGTTGTAKGAMLTHFNLVSNAIACSFWSGSNQNDITLAVIPYFHIYGLTCAMNAPIYSGQKIVLLPSFNSKEVLATIDSEKISNFPGVPTMYVALLHDPDLEKHSLKTIKRCLSGAAPLPVEVQKQFDEITGGNLVEGYGLTEASPVTHANILRPNAPSRIGSIGIPYPDTSVKIVNIESGERVSTGEIGELAIKGPQVMKGYWKNPEETSRVMKDGWLLTGDIGKIDEEGFFYIVDRKKDLIDASGFKVWPREVEEILFAHPGVKEAAVVGVPDEYRGETVKAFVVLKGKNPAVSAEEIKAFCKERIAAYKVPRIVEFTDELPKSLVGKVLRRKLREAEAATHG
jgi:long-chain acyl-CoA synthetase